jgi:hypothetical protein
MKLGFGNRISNEDSVNGPAGMINDPDHLVEVAQSYFASDFPNHSRTGCPPEGALDELILSEELPGDGLRAHLFGCSECFRNYRRLVALHRATVTETHISWWHRVIGTFKQHPLPAFVGLIVMCICVVTGFFIWRASVREIEPGVARNASQPAASPTSARIDAPVNIEEMPDVVTDAQPPVKPTEQVSRPERGKRKGRLPEELLASNTIRIDLEKYSLLRGDDGMSDEAAIELPVARNRLLMTLPASSSKGIYTLSVVDAYGRELVSHRAASRDGRSLTADLDTRVLRAGKYRLCVSLPAEVPDCYPFTVARK